MLKLVMDCAIGAVSEAHFEERYTLKQLRTVWITWTVQWEPWLKKGNMRLSGAKRHMLEYSQNNLG